MTGQFVTSKAGHDKDTLYLIVAEEGDFVELCDGRSRLLQKPKRKRRKHIQPINQMADESLVQALLGGKATDERIRAAIKQYTAKRQGNSF
ncbi:MAG: KOW domain-containing RNA-binding protein [Clostridium sp.]|nr:KOW domain-containing RNA-binding protein [Acetatifactor muris]MCM1526459.1 KOW domain-containing RNA-binding protein [Bacteroides sp.]MCM1563178.1 KOW domain-containing RNA-binding protein [Clostridium sp.]